MSSTYVSCYLPFLHCLIHCFATPWWNWFFPSSKYKVLEWTQSHNNNVKYTTCSSQPQRWFGRSTLLHLTQEYTNKIEFDYRGIMLDRPISDEWQIGRCRKEFKVYAWPENSFVDVFSMISRPPWCSHCFRLISPCKNKWMWESWYCRRNVR